MRACSDPANDPNDWFISKDGKQYADDEFLTAAERAGLEKSVLPIEGESAEDHQARVDKAIYQAESARKRANLQRRRHAKEACQTGCYFRTQCLDQALNNNEVHGTWGGYYEEELRAIRIEIARRKRNRA